MNKTDSEKHLSWLCNTAKENTSKSLQETLSNLGFNEKERNIISIYAKPTCQICKGNKEDICIISNRKSKMVTIKDKIYHSCCLYYKCYNKYAWGFEELPMARRIKQY